MKKKCSDSKIRGQKLATFESVQWPVHSMQEIVFTRNGNPITWIDIEKITAAVF